MSKEFFDCYSEVVKSIGDLSKKRREENPDVEILYRGEPQKYPYISSGLYRFLSDECDWKTLDLDDCDWDTLDHKVKNHIICECEEFIKKDIVFFEDVDRFYLDKYFAEIQHFGGVTNLIDFTKDINIALSFACNEPERLMGDEEGPGRIIIYYHDRKNRNKNSVMRSSKGGYSQFQSSIFIRPFENGILKEDEDCVDIFDIPFGKKEPIVIALKEYYNITARSVYADLHGYIRNQKKFLKGDISNWLNNRGKK